MRERVRLGRTRRRNRGLAPRPLALRAAHFSPKPHAHMDAGLMAYTCMRAACAAGSPSHLEGVATATATAASAAASARRGMEGGASDPAAAATTDRRWPAAGPERARARTGIGVCVCSVGRDGRKERVPRWTRRSLALHKSKRPKPGVVCSFSSHAAPLGRHHTYTHAHARPARRPPGYRHPARNARATPFLSRCALLVAPLPNETLSGEGKHALAPAHAQPHPARPTSAWAACLGGDVRGGAPRFLVGACHFLSPLCGVDRPSLTCATSTLHRAAPRTRSPNGRDGHPRTGRIRGPPPPRRRPHPGGSGRGAGPGRAGRVCR